MSAGIPLQAAIQWHKAGMLGSPNAASVVLTQAIVDELLEARQLLHAVSRRADATDIVPDEWLTNVMNFTVRTNDLEQFRGR